METLVIIAAAFLYSIFCASICKMIAASKGRDASNWVVLGFIFGVVGIIGVGFLPEIPKTE